MMTNLQKSTCSSVVLHGLLLALFVVISAHPLPKTDAGPSVMSIDLDLGGGGKADPVPAPAPAPPPTPVEDLVPPTPTVKDVPAPAPAPTVTDHEPAVGPEILKPKTKKKPVDKPVPPPADKVVKPSPKTPTAKEAEAQRLENMRKLLVKNTRKTTVKIPAITGLDTRAITSTISSKISNGSVSISVSSARPGAGGDPNAAPGGGPGGGGNQDRFIAGIRSILWKAWDQPSEMEVKGKPVTAVAMTVRADGRITEARILKPSGSTVMDASVEKLFRELKTLPALATFGVTSREVTLQINFTLD